MTTRTHMSRRSFGKMALGGTALAAIGAPAIVRAQTAITFTGASLSSDTKTGPMTMYMAKLSPTMRRSRIRSLLMSVHMVPSVVSPGHEHHHVVEGGPVDARILPAAPPRPRRVGHEGLDPVRAPAHPAHRQVTEPLEASINGVDGIRTLTSTSRDGRSTIKAEFDLGMDLERAANDVRDHVSRAMRNLPPDVEPPIVSKADADSSPIVFLNIKSDQRSLLELTDEGPGYSMQLLNLTFFRPVRIELVSG